MEDNINRKIGRLRLKINTQVNGMKEIETRKIAFGLGIGLTCFSLGLFFLLFLDILFFPTQPWPYTDGGGFDYILLHKSLFWEQFIHHCQFLWPSLLGLLIWSCWFIPFIIGSSLILNYAHEFQLENNKVYQIIDKTIPYSSIGVFVLNSLLYFVYALRFQKSFNYTSEPYFVLIESFRLIFFLPIIAILPMIINHMLYKVLKSSRRIYLIIAVFILTFYIVFSFMSIIILLGGCI